MKKYSRLAILAAGPLAIIADPALAASSADWITPVGDGVTSLTTTLVTIGGAIIGLSIVGYGLWAAMTQRIDWARIWVFFVAGLLVTVGPAAIIWFIKIMQKA